MAQALKSQEGRKTKDRMLRFFPGVAFTQILLIFNKIVYSGSAQPPLLIHTQYAKIAVSGPYHCAREARRDRGQIWYTCQTSAIMAIRAAHNNGRTGRAKSGTVCGVVPDTVSDRE